jgi:hypothetical protein
MLPPYNSREQLATFSLSHGSPTFLIVLLTNTFLIIIEYPNALNLSFFLIKRKLKKKK